MPNYFCFAKSDSARQIYSKHFISVNDELNDEPCKPVKYFSTNQFSIEMYLRKWEKTLQFYHWNKFFGKV